MRSTEWHGLRINVPEGYALTTNSLLLEVIETDPVPADNDRWPSRMAFLDLDSAAEHRFHEAAANCDLAVDRCWSETVATHTVSCQRSGGVPDPELRWTPHLECQVPSLSIRVASNAPSGTTLEYLEMFRAAVATVPPDYPAVLR